MISPMSIHVAMRTQHLFSAIFFLWCISKVNVQLEKLNGGFKVLLANVNIPDCINTVIEDYNFEYFANGTISLKSSRDTTITNYTVSTDKKTITYCQHVSPQLRYCNLTRLKHDNYTLVNHTLCASNDLMAQLGDYYIDKEGDALTCNESILAPRTTPRCNYIALRPDQYEIFHNGSLLLKPAKTVIERAQIRENNSSITLCYPLSIDILNCRRKSFKVTAVLTVLDSELNLQFSSENQVRGLGDYYRTEFGDALICPSDNYLVMYAYFATAYDVLRYISSIYLVLTIFCQLMAPTITCYTKSQICHFACLITYYSCCPFVRHKFNMIRPCAPWQCYLTFFVYFYSSLAALFWLNVLSFHLYKSFSHLNQMPVIQGASAGEKLRFHFYSAYAFGTPAIIVIFILAIDNSPKLQETFSMFPYIRADYNLHDRTTTICFYIFPILLLMGVNVVFFTITMLNIHKASKETESANKRHMKELVAAWLKLFCIMGIPIAMEGIMWCVRNYIHFEYWYVSDVFISLPGIAVFCTIVCRKDNLQLLVRKICTVFLRCKLFLKGG